MKSTMLNVVTYFAFYKDENFYFKCFKLHKLYMPGVPKKNRRLINIRTNVYCLIVRIFPILDKTYTNLDFEIKIVEIC